MDDPPPDPVVDFMTVSPPHPSSKAADIETASARIIKLTCILTSIDGGAWQTVRHDACILLGFVGRWYGTGAELPAIHSIFTVQSRMR